MGVGSHPHQTPPPFLGLLRLLHSCRCPPYPTHPRLPKHRDQSLLPPAFWQSRPAVETAWRRYQVVRLRGQTPPLGKAPYSRLCTKDRMECGRTGAGGPRMHRGPVLLPKQHGKAPRRPGVRGGEADGCDEMPWGTEAGPLHGHSPAPVWYGVRHTYCQRRSPQQHL